MRSVCFVVSDPLTAKTFLTDHLKALARSYKVALVFNPKAAGRSPVAWSIPGVESIPVPIRRNASPAADIRALIALVRLYRERRFDVTHSVTPKAGLLNIVAGTMANVPIRLHTFTGQVWVTKTGLVRKFLKGCDMAIARLASHLLADSFSQRDFLIRERVVAGNKIAVLAEGSISGVDTDRFQPDAHARKRIRGELGIPDSACAFLFTGRLNPDKGLFTLAEAFIDVAGKHPGVFLLVVGPDEAGTKPRIERLCEGVLHRMRFVGYTERPEDYMAAADVFCLPSRREGFGSVVIEAAAAGLPAIASRIYGLTDAVEDGVTGLLHAVDDSADLARKMSLLAESPALARALAHAARQRALQHFTRQRVTDAMEAYYRSLLGHAAAAEARRFDERYSKPSGEAVS